jgi:hypothetical protein
VLVMDCTMTGALLPTRTPAIEAVKVFLRLISAIRSLILPCEFGRFSSPARNGVKRIRRPALMIICSDL